MDELRGPSSRECCQLREECGEQVGGGPGTGSRALCSPVVLQFSHALVLD